MSVLPSVAGAMLGLLSGYLADTFVKNNVLSSNGDNINTRKLFQGMAMLGLCTYYFMASHHVRDSPAQSQLLLTTSTAF